MENTINKITVIGAGFLGTEIAVRALTFGYEVSLFDISPDALSNSRNTIMITIAAKPELKSLAQDPEMLDQKLSFHQDMPSAVEKADLVIEAVAEDLEIKKKVFTRLDEIAPPGVILASNSSSIPVSRLEPVVTHKSRIINLHFSAPIEKSYYVDVMRGNETSEAVLNRSTQWLESLECLPLVCKKESIGFVFNRIWHAARREALKVWAEGYADYKDVDKAWMLFSGMSVGPFGLMDYIGLDIVYDVQDFYFQENSDPYFKPPEELKKMIENGGLGMKSGKGFYSWPNPDCFNPNFLKPGKQKS